MELTRFDATDRLEDAPQRSFGDLMAIEAALRRRFSPYGKLMRGPDGTSIELFGSLEDRYAPYILIVDDRPVERGRTPIAPYAGMHDQAEIARPNFLRDGDLQHWRNNQIRRLMRSSRDHGLARRCDADTNFVAELAEFDQ